MVKLACIGTCYLPTGKESKEHPQGALEKYEDQTYDSDPEGDVYEFTEKQADMALATGNFVPVDE